MSGTRTGRIERTTSESSVLVELDLDGTGRTDISTSVQSSRMQACALQKLTSATVSRRQCC